MKVILHILFVYFFTQSVYTQESFRFEWEIEDNIHPIEGFVDTDGNTIVVGYINKIEQNYDSDGFIFKMTPEGSFEYYRYPFSPDSNLFFEEVIQLDNGNYFVIGSYGPKSFTDPDETLMTLVFDTNLNLLMEQEYCLPDTCKLIADPKAIIEEDGTIIMAAITKSIGYPTNSCLDLAFYQFSQDGVILNNNFVHYPFNVNKINDLDKIPDSPNYLLIEQAIYGIGSGDCYILQPNLEASNINYFGSLDYSIGGEKNMDYWYPDKSFLIGTDMLYYSKYERGLGVVRLDTLANIIDNLFLNKVGIYDKSAHYSPMAFAGVESIYVAGYMADSWDCSSPDSIELYVVDTALNQIAYKSLGGDISYDAFGVLAAKDKGAIIYGIAWHEVGENCHANLVIYYVNRKDLGLPPVKVFETESFFQDAKVYPNPSNGLIHIRIEKKLLKSNSRIKIFNPNGQKVYDYQLPNIGNTIQLDITNLDEGLYVYHITNGDSIISTGKFIKN